MPKIISVGESIPNYEVDQEEAVNFARELFSESFKDIERLLKAFQNGQIEKRHFVRGLEWFQKDRTFEERNNAYIESAVEYGTKAILQCLENSLFLTRKIECEEIDAIFLISSTGLATPSIDARIMNKLSFSPHTKRIPIWGLGCAGGASGLSRAYEYCLAHPDSKVIVLTIELCSLTFQRNDRSKSNLIGTSLFADGISCALICGSNVDTNTLSKRNTHPVILGTQSTLMPNSLDVMGWDIKNEGLYVIFSRDIPHIVEEWLMPNVEGFMKSQNVPMAEIAHFVAHPGGKKVLEAYVNSLGIDANLIQPSLEVLKQFGNMSSSTILYVLKKHMEMDINKGEYGLAAALGPGFSSELLLLRWE